MLSSIAYEPSSQIAISMPSCEPPGTSVMSTPSAATVKAWRFTVEEERTVPMRMTSFGLTLMMMPPAVDETRAPAS